MATESKGLELIMVTRDDFEAWLMFLDDCISQLIGYLPNDVSARLDFTPESLVPLESWLLATYDSPALILERSEVWVLDRCTRYVGEVLRINSGGVWDIDLVNEDNTFFGLPVVKKGRWVDCPASLVTAALDRRQGNYMKRVIEKLIEE